MNEGQLCVKSYRGQETLVGKLAGKLMEGSAHVDGDRVGVHSSGYLDKD